MPKLIFNVENTISLKDFEYTLAGVTEQGGVFITNAASDSEGKFTSNPCITVSLSDNDNIMNAFRILSATDEWGIPLYVDLDFKFYKGDKLIDEFTTDNRGCVYVAGDMVFFYDARHFNKIVITFTKMRYGEEEAGVQGAIKGISFRSLIPVASKEIPYEVDKFINLKIKESIDILSSDVPINSCECEIIGDEELYLRKFTEFDIENDGEYFGRFYIVDFKRTGEKSYSISANSILGKLDNYQYDGWTLGAEITPPDNIYYNTGKGIAVKNNTDYKNYTGYLSSNTARYALCQIGWAQNLMIDESRRSYIELVSIPSESKGLITNLTAPRIIGNATISAEQYYTKAKYSIINYNPFKQYELVEIGKVEGTFTSPTKYYWQNAPCQYLKASTDINVIEITNNYIIFTKPEAEKNTSEYIAHGTTTNYLNIRRAPVNGAIITSMPTGSTFSIYSIDNGWAHLNYNGIIGYSSIQYMTIDYIETGTSKDITFYGYKFEETQEDVIITNRLFLGTEANEVSYDKYTLCAIDENGSLKDIKSGTIQQIIESDGTINCTLVLHGEKIGDMVDIETAYDGIVRGIITSLEYTPSAQMIANATITLVAIGLAPLQVQSESDVSVYEYAYDKFDNPIYVLPD